MPQPSITKNPLENYISKISFKFPRGQWIKNVAHFDLHFTQTHKQIWQNSDLSLSLYYKYEETIFYILQDLDNKFINWFWNVLQWTISKWRCCLTIIKMRLAHDCLIFMRIYIPWKTFISKWSPELMKPTHMSVYLWAQTLSTSVSYKFKVPPGPNIMFLYES